MNRLSNSTSIRPLSTWLHTQFMVLSPDPLNAILDDNVRHHRTKSTIFRIPHAVVTFP